MDRWNGSASGGPAPSRATTVRAGTTTTSGSSVAPRRADGIGSGGFEGRAAPLRVVFAAGLAGAFLRAFAAGLAGAFLRALRSAVAMGHPRARAYSIRSYFAAARSSRVTWRERILSSASYAAYLYASPSVG